MTKKEVLSNPHDIEIYVKAFDKGFEEGAKAERERLQNVIDRIRLRTRNYIDNDGARRLLN